MKQSLMKDMGLKLVSLGLAVMLWWIIKLGADLRYSYSRSNEPVRPVSVEQPDPSSLTNAIPGITPEGNQTER